MALPPPRLLDLKWSWLGSCLLMIGCAPASSPPAGDPLASTPAQWGNPTELLDFIVREPMILEAFDGALYVAGHGAGFAKLYRSVDEGQTWQLVPVGPDENHAVGNSDVDLALGPDGTVYFIAMSFDREAYEGTGIAVGTLRPGEPEWDWVSLSEDRFDDRPWVEVAPDGTAHAIWNDGRGVAHAVSEDRGVSWQERPRIHDMGLSSHLAIGPGGEIAVRITPLSASANQYDEGVDHLAVSSDGGDSWEILDPPGTRMWSRNPWRDGGVPRWVDPLAWDEAGHLYHVWSEGTSLWLGRSADGGHQWETWRIAEDAAMVFYPYLIANGPGRLAATWYAGSTNDFDLHVALINLNEMSDSEPTVDTLTPIRFDAYSMDETGAMSQDTAGEYVPIAFLRDGTLAIATTIQDPEGDRWGFTWRPIQPADSRGEAQTP